jgi:hypothetical protein
MALCPMGDHRQVSDGRRLPDTKLLSPMVSRTLKTGRVETKGAMPPNYPKPTGFCDCNHQQRYMDKPSFALAHAALFVSTWTPVDGIKLKIISFALQQNQRKSIEVFRKAMLNVLEHHFDKHEGCREWCPTKKWKHKPGKKKYCVTETRTETERLTSRYKQFEPSSLLSRNLMKCATPMMQTSAKIS